MNVTVTHAAGCFRRDESVGNANFAVWWMEENALQLVVPAQVGGLLVQYGLSASPSSLGIAQHRVRGQD